MLWGSIIAKGHGFLERMQLNGETDKMGIDLLIGPVIALIYTETENIMAIFEKFLRK